MQGAKIGLTHILICKGVYLNYFLKFMGFFILFFCLWCYLLFSPKFKGFFVPFAFEKYIYSSLYFAILYNLSFPSIFLYLDIIIHYPVFQHVARAAAILFPPEASIEEVMG